MRTIMIAAVAIIVAFSIGSLVYTTYGSGTLVFKMTDPPTDWGPAAAVYINYTNIQIHRADAGNQSGWISTGISGALNLLEIVDVNKTIGQLSLQAGLYDFVRFNVYKRHSGLRRSQIFCFRREWHAECAHYP